VYRLGAIQLCASSNGDLTGLRAVVAKIDITKKTVKEALLGVTPLT
jgi:hypothetical protein